MPLPRTTHVTNEVIQFVDMEYWFDKPLMIHGAGISSGGKDDDAIQAMAGRPVRFYTWGWGSEEDTSLHVGPIDGVVFERRQTEGVHVAQHGGHPSTHSA